jgi:ABC-type bacteriocin/lantibiotic exporter with double-glycine peptidase domain
MQLRRGWSCAAALAVLAAGCASAPRGAGPPGELPARRSVALEVPFHAQRPDGCGAASLAMLLDWSGRRADLDSLEQELRLPQRRGVLQISLLSAARRRGRLAYGISGAQELLGELAGGHPVLVLQNRAFSWSPVWHYAVVIGYDLDRGSVTLHSDTRPMQKLSWTRFDRTWAASERWGMVVLPCSEAPITARGERLQEAREALERAGQPQCAEQVQAAR